MEWNFTKEALLDLDFYRGVVLWSRAGRVDGGRRGFPRDAGVRRIVFDGLASKPSWLITFVRMISIEGACLGLFAIVSPEGIWFLGGRNAFSHRHVYEEAM